MKIKRTSEQITTINGGNIPDNFSGKAEVIYKKIAYIVGYEVEFSRSTLPDYWGETDFYIYVEPVDLEKVPQEIRGKIIKSIRQSVSAEYDIYDI